MKEPIGRWSLAVLAAGFIYVVISLIGIASRFPNRDDVGLLLFDLAVLVFCFTVAWVIRRIP